MANENCLACPKCESEGPFLLIGVKTTVEVSDEGAADIYGDTEWADDSYCGCRQCGHAANVAAFTKELP